MTITDLNKKLRRASRMRKWRKGSHRRHRFGWPAWEAYVSHARSGYVPFGDWPRPTEDEIHHDRWAW